jgi:hypothetical protein
VLCSADRQDDQPLSWFSPKTAKSASPQSANDRDVSNLAGGQLSRRAGRTERHERARHADARRLLIRSGGARLSSYAALGSSCSTLDALGALIAIRRGFIASGISRTNSTWSRPLSNRAPLTSTYSAKLNCRLNGRAGMP